MEHSCPKCHIGVRESDFFCFHCGKNLHPVPLRTDILTELLYYGASVLFPPFGFLWGIRYLRQDDAVSKRIAYVTMGLTVVSTIITVMWSIQLISGISAEVDKQLETIQGY